MLPFWPTSLYETVLAKGLLLILWLLLVTSCPVMISAASWHHSAVIRNDPLITVLKQRDGQGLCLKQTWAGFLMQFHGWSAVASISMLHPLTPAWYNRSVPMPVWHPASPSPHCWPQVVADLRGGKNVAAREPEVSFGDVLHMEEAGNPLS